MSATISNGDPREVLRELREVALRQLLLALIVVTTLPLWFLAAFPTIAGLAPLFLSLALAFTWIAARLSLRVSARLSAAVLVAGLLASVTLAMDLYPRSLAGLGFGAIAVVATVLLGPRSGLLTAVLASVAVLLAATGRGLQLDPANGAAILVFPWGALALAWIFWEPVDSALRWAWGNIDRNIEIAEELRGRQVELSQFNRSLNDAYARLEELSRDLNRARRSAEEARRRKVEFATSISHELRTPLNLIIGFSEMMLLGPRARAPSVPVETFRGDVEAIYRNASHLSSLIDDVLDLSQIDAHRMGLRREPVRLGQIVDEAMTAVEMLFQERGLSLSIELPPEPIVIHADRVRIRQVLINLLSNAARFTTHGGVIIRVCSDEHEATVSVADTGNGIAPEDLPTVFDEFRQVGAQGSRRHSGLGLAICKRFVELHAGSIWVESAPGEGADFHFTLPRAGTITPVPFEPNWETLARAVERAPQEPTILLLDDDPDIARIFRRYLDGYQIAAVADPVQLRPLIQTTSIHAVIATRTGSWQPWDCPELRDIPRLTCPLHSIHEAAANLGVVDYLRKPVSRAQLRTSLSQIGAPIRDVLVVDDDSDMTRLLARMVRAEFRRCHVATARDGRQALDLLLAGPPSAVLLDLVMPHFDGYWLLNQMRADENLRDVPVVIVTARGDEVETVVASGIEISRTGGLSVGDAMVCLQRSLDWLLRGPGATDIARAPLEDRGG